MNFYGLEETPYIPMNIILEFLGSFGAQKYVFYTYVKFCTVFKCFFISIILKLETSFARGVNLAPSGMGM
jgi:hypothetical protein